MTGFQEHPGTGKRASGEPTKVLLIEDAAKGLGADFIRVIDPFNVREATEALKEAIDHLGVSVVVAKGDCALNAFRRKEEVGEGYYVDAEACVACGRCVDSFACPATIWSDQEHEGKRIPMIDLALCNSCGVCAQICPQGAIKPVK
jgi:indolepyruvate ferredoxin oxidoreductase alpha subunit